jgi:hypothetical protein
MQMFYLPYMKFGSGARDEVFDALRAIAHRIRVPHQAALEFSRNRRRVVVERVSNFRRVCRNVQSATKEAIAYSSRQLMRFSPYVSGIALVEVGTWAC